MIATTSRPWRWLRRPCWPCTLLPAGQPGVLEIGARAYAVLPLGEYPSRGFRVTSDRGDCYDLDAANPRALICDCPDATFRGRECKHARAVREAIASLFVDAPTAPDAIDAAALEEGEALACCREED